MAKEKTIEVQVVVKGLKTLKKAFELTSIKEFDEAFTRVGLTIKEMAAGYPRLLSPPLSPLSMLFPSPTKSQTRAEMIAAFLADDEQEVSDKLDEAPKPKVFSATYQPIIRRD